MQDHEDVSWINMGMESYTDNVFVSLHTQCMTDMTELKEMLFDQPLCYTGGLASCPGTLCHMDWIKTPTFQLAGNLLCLLSYSCPFNKTYDTFGMNFFLFLDKHNQTVITQFVKDGVVDN